MKRGVARFAQYAKLASAGLAVRRAARRSEGRRDRVCPSECSAREVEVGGRCVAKACGRGEIHRTERPLRRQARRAAPGGRQRRAEAHGSAKGHCFSFNGNQYCE